MGADLQYLRDDRRNFRSDAGVPLDSTYVDQQEKVLELGPFVQLHWSPIAQLVLGAGARYDRVEFDVTDRFFADGDDDSGERTLDSWNGNVGASWFVSEAVVPYANVSTVVRDPHDDRARQPSRRRRRLQPGARAAAGVELRGRRARAGGQQGGVLRQPGSSPG